MSIGSHMHVEILKCDSPMKINGVMPRMISPSVGITGHRKGVSRFDTVYVEGMYQHPTRVTTTGNLRKYGISGKPTECFMSGKSIGMRGLKKVHPSILANIEIDYS